MRFHLGFLGLSIVMMFRTYGRPKVTAGVGMDYLGSGRARRRAVGIARGWRAHRALMLAIGTLLVASVVLFVTRTAQANAPGPTDGVTGTAFVNPDGTVTVTVGGTWEWPFASTQFPGGLHATVQHPCDRRSGAGWGVVWSDPQDPGYTETYHSKYLSLTVKVGSRGVNPANTDHAVIYNTMDPCGTFTETDVPAAGDGNVTGTWKSTHVYASAAMVPASVCVVTYDLGFGLAPAPKYLKFSNDDNSVAWSLQDMGSWNNSIGGPNCAQLPALQPAPATTPATPAKPASQVTPSAPATPPATGGLAFTGFSATGRLLTLLGMVLVILGLAVYFVDAPKTAQWLVGFDASRTSPPRPSDKPVVGPIRRSAYTRFYVARPRRQSHPSPSRGIDRPRRQSHPSPYRGIDRPRGR
jgi:hypothetical protein